MTEWQDIEGIWMLSILIYIVFLLTNNLGPLIASLFGSFTGLAMTVTKFYDDFVEWRKNKKRNTTKVV
jgi:hypothetical protein